MVAGKARSNRKQRIDSRVHKGKAVKGIGGRGGGEKTDKEEKPEGARHIVDHTIDSIEAPK